MKQLFNILCVLAVVWLCSCQSKETEAYLQNLAEENATLLEVIQKKNQEMDQLTAQLQQLEATLALNTAEAVPATGSTKKLVLQATSARPVKQADSLTLPPTKVVVAAGYPSTVPAVQAKSPELISTQAKLPKNVEQFLNQLSDPAIALATRKEWKKAILLTFASKSVDVFAEKKGFVNRYTAEALLDLLVYFPHQVRVSKVVKDPTDKIIQLRIQMYRQKI